MGEMLREKPKATGGDAQRTRFRKDTESPPTLADLGVSKKESVQAQFLADLSLPVERPAGCGEQPNSQHRQQHNRQKQTEMSSKQAHDTGLNIRLRAKRF